MTDDTPACVHDWIPDRTGVTPANGATNVRSCTRCDALDWDEPDDAAPNSAATGSNLGGDQSCVCRLNLFACPVHPRTFQPQQAGSWWEIPIQPPVPFAAGESLPVPTPEQVVALMAPAKPGNRPSVGTVETDENGFIRIDFRATDLHWGESIGTDASRTDREIHIPVCDDDGRELGEMRMGYANAAVLGAMLTDAGRRSQPKPSPAAPPRPVTDPPAHVDACPSDTYDAILRRLAWHEDCYRTRVESDMGRALLNATARLGWRDAAIARVRDRVRQLANEMADMIGGSVARAYADRILDALDQPAQEQT
jgi:hypothetical protein